MSNLVLGSIKKDPLTREDHDGNEADLEHYSTSGSESDDDDDDDDCADDSDDSITKDMDSIGRFANFKLPNFWSNISLYTNKESNVDDENTSTVASTIGAQTISRREQVSNFIEDLKSGFSLQSALDRLQTIRSVLETSINETIDNNVDTDLEDGDVEEEENYEPHVITAAVEPKDVPMLDQMIIPENKDPIIHPPHHKKSHRHQHHHHHHHHHHERHTEVTNSELEELAYVSQSELNDEMFLRRRIKKIRRLSISEEEKNRLTQKLMMGAHYDKIRFVDDNGDEVLQITADQKESQEVNAQEDDRDLNVESSEAEESDDDLVIVNEEDKTPTYHNESMDILGCPHYQRNCKMECPHCKKWFGCPICHDEFVSDHNFIREETNHIMCLKCFNVQEPSEFCDSCDIQFALYYCSKCKLYDNDENKDIYHCDDCGICRLGLGLGQDFFHCKGCNACLSIELQDDHRCIERATQSDCPICGEYMFTSVKPVVFMSCGHAIHQGCYEDHSKHSYKCPTCQKTVLNMEAQFRVLDMEISLQPLPQPYCQWTCVVSCNDCNAKSSCPYHVLGLKCDNCKSYNTVQVKLIKPEESDYESDISTTTNNLRRGHHHVRNLRNLPLRSSHLLNTNYNIENDDHSEIEEKSIEDKKENDDGHRKHRSNTGTATPGETTIMNGSIETGPRTLTLPQQLLSNFDNFVNNIHDSSSDSEDSDEQDFLRVNKSLRNRNRFISDIFSDSTPEVEDIYDRMIDDKKENDEGHSVGVASVIKDFFISGSLSGMINDMNNDKSDDDMDNSDENKNGF